jgi:hypothetical protein
MIVAWHEVPGGMRKITPSQRDDWSGVRSVSTTKIFGTDQGTDHDFDRPSGTGASLYRYPGTSCLATISLSLRDKGHSPVEAPRIKT